MRPGCIIARIREEHKRVRSRNDGVILEQAKRAEANERYAAIKALDAEALFEIQKIASDMEALWREVFLGADFSKKQTYAAYRSMERLRLCSIIQ